jgi:hypothetical protein
VQHRNRWLAANPALSTVLRPYFNITQSQFCL